ncbi:DsbA family protein [Nocardia sp. NPDC052001]|uniref:2-hydroxychromene-2-carboxylate isomerase n=1 Tax=Nocardia sp. NPDC052001 TaxID=3154853 RepID=UPI0034382445
MKTAPRVYFSFRSPYSWLAFHDLRREHPELVSALEWRPFWEPDEHFSALLAETGHEFPYTPMSRAKHFYLLRDIRRLAGRRGLANSWPLDEQMHWEPSHLGWFAASDHGLAHEYADRVYTARWLSGLDICRTEVIQSILDELAIPADVGELVRSPAIEKRALDALQAVCQEDVFGVPMFIHRREKYWGIDRLADFLAALPGSSIAQPESTAATGAPDGLAEIPVPKETAEIGHAGGCG